MATPERDNVDYRLLNNLSNLVICSHCLRKGKVTPVPQIISRQQRPNNVCTLCQHKKAGGIGQSFGQILRFTRR